MILVKKSISAGLLISIGVYGLLFTNYSIASILLFSFALYSICTRDYYLYTGKCGYLYRAPGLNLRSLLTIFVINAFTCYILGFIFSIITPEIYAVAAEKVAGWSVTSAYSWKSFFCGVIMFLAVKIFKEQNNPLGILIGVPLFLLCGFQHSIANAAILGAAQTWSPAILLCAFENFIGAAIMNGLEGT